MMPNMFFPYQYISPQFPLLANLFNPLSYPLLHQQNSIHSMPWIQNYYLENANFQRTKQYANTEICQNERSNIEPHVNSMQQVTQNNKQSQQIKENQNKTRQKYGRNITSNIFRSLIKRITGEIRFKKLAQAAIKQKKLSITYENFIQELNNAISTFSSYVKKHQMKSLIVAKPGNKKSQEICSLFRILAKIYLRQQHTLNIFYSKKINKGSRQLHFILARQMQNFLK